MRPVVSHASASVPRARRAAATRSVGKLLAHAQNAILGAGCALLDERDTLEKLLQAGQDDVYRLGNATMILGPGEILGTLQVELADLLQLGGVTLVSRLGQLRCGDQLVGDMSERRHHRDGWTLLGLCGDDGSHLLHPVGVPQGRAPKLQNVQSHRGSSGRSAHRGRTPLLQQASRGCRVPHWSANCVTNCWVSCMEG